MRKFNQPVSSIYSTATEVAAAKETEVLDNLQLHTI
jgi:hypothetical protein